MKKHNRQDKKTRDATKTHRSAETPTRNPPTDKFLPDFEPCSSVGGMHAIGEEKTNDTKKSDTNTRKRNMDKDKTVR